jgi:glycosyltransferase involved in cell wall biosynthesis
MSIVIIFFNQAGYLEEAIRSVLVQEYPRLDVSWFGLSPGRHNILSHI